MILFYPLLNVKLTIILDIKCTVVVSTIAKELTGSTIVPYQGVSIDLTPPWRRISMSDLVLEKTGVDFAVFMEKNDATSAREAALKAGVGVELLSGKNSPGEILNVAFEELCEVDLVQPTFVMDHPMEVSEWVGE